MSWTPDAPDPVQRWVADGETVLDIVKQTVVVPYLPPQSDDDDSEPFFLVDLSSNVSGGRQPYVFEINPLVNTLPPASRLEPNGRLLIPWGGTINASYQAGIIVTDADGQQAKFLFSTRETLGPLAFTNVLVGGKIPAAHGGIGPLATPYSYQFTTQGGIPPITFAFVGPQSLGIEIDPGAGVLYGRYNNLYGNSPDNIVQAQAFNAGNETGIPDATLDALWDLFTL